MFSYTDLCLPTLREYSLSASQVLPIVEQWRKPPAKLALAGTFAKSRFIACSSAADHQVDVNYRSCPYLICEIYELRFSDVYSLMCFNFRYCIGELYEID